MGSHQDVPAVALRDAMKHLLADVGRNLRTSTTETENMRTTVHYCPHQQRTALLTIHCQQVRCRRCKHTFDRMQSKVTRIMHRLAP